MGTKAKRRSKRRSRCSSGVGLGKAQPRPGAESPKNRVSKEVGKRPTPGRHRKAGGKGGTRPPRSWENTDPGRTLQKTGAVVQTKGSFRLAKVVKNSKVKKNKKPKVKKAKKVKKVRKPKAKNVKKPKAKKGGKKVQKPKASKGKKAAKPKKATKPKVAKAEKTAAAATKAPKGE